MNKIITCLAMATAIGSGSLVADNVLGGSLRLTGEYLYLKPTVESNYFVQKSNSDPAFSIVEGKQIQSQLSYNSGYRAEIGYTLCGKGEVSLGYTHLTDSSSKRVNGEFLSPVIGNDFFASNYDYYTGYATQNLDLRFKTWGAYYTFPLFSNTCCDFSLIFGAEYADIKFNQEANYVDTESLDDLTGKVTLTSKTRGAGPMAGFKLDCPIFTFGCDCPHTIRFKGSASGSLLVTRNIGNANVVTIDNVTGDIDELFVNVKRERSSDVTPVLFARFGLAYDYKFECVITSWEIGYQLASYYNAVVRTHMPQSVSASPFSFHRYNNFNLQGLYVSGSLNF